MKKYTFSLEEAIEQGRIPRKKFSDKTDFKKEELEKGCRFPDYLPKENATIFTNKKGIKIFRKDDSFKTHTKEGLYSLGLTDEDLKDIKPDFSTFVHSINRTVDFYTVRELRSALRRIEDERQSAKEFNFYKDTYLKNIDGFDIYFIGMASYDDYEDEDYDEDDEDEYYDTKRTSKILFQYKNDCNITLHVNVPIKSKTYKGYEADHALDSLSPYIEKTLPDIKTIFETYSNLDKSYLYISIQIDKDTDVKEELETIIKARIEKEERKETFQKLISNKPYEEHFPARKLNRTIIIYEAPTNSGKTYNACNEVIRLLEKETDKGVCMFPLRALAAQQKDDFMSKGIKCSLITGEEREIEENAKIESITTEAISVERMYKVAFIDESQLLFDEQRGAAYTKAIIGTYAETIILAVAPAYKDALIYWIKRILPNDTIEERALTRLCPLHVLEKPVSKAQIEKGDLVVAFTTKDIHYIAEDLSDKFKVGVIYGRMSPSARRAMVRDFMNEGFDVLVATDAIGMGISVPVKRVLFSTLQKFDGQIKRTLRNEEIRQVAGRAGRFGFHEEGFTGTFEWGYKSSENNLEIIKRVIETPIQSENNGKRLSISPDKHIFLSAEHLTLLETIRVWEKVAVSDFYKINHSVLDDLKKKASFLDKLEDIPKRKIVDLLFITFNNDREDTWFNQYKKMVLTVQNNEKLEIDKYNGNKNIVSYFEDFAILLTLFSQFQRIYPELSPKEEIIMEMQTICGEQMTALLKEKYAEAKRKNQI